MIQTRCATFLLKQQFFLYNLFKNAYVYEHKNAQFYHHDYKYHGDTKYHVLPQIYSSRHQAQTSHVKRQSQLLISGKMRKAYYILLKFDACILKQLQSGDYHC